MNGQRVYTWRELAADRKLWIAFLWRAMGLSGKGYKRHSLRHTGKQEKDGSWDRRADKIEGPLAGVPKFFRSYNARYAAPPIKSRACGFAKERNMNAEFARLVAEQARKELRAEQFREAIEKEKLRLKTKRSLFDRLFPYRIYFVRKT